MIQENVLEIKDLIVHIERQTMQTSDQNAKSESDTALLYQTTKIKLFGISGKKDQASSKGKKINYQPFFATRINMCPHKYHTSSTMSTLSKKKGYKMGAMNKSNEFKRKPKTGKRWKNRDM